MEPFEGLRAKTVFITGAAQGIGLGVSRYLLQLGARVVMADRDEEAGREALNALQGLGEIRFVHTDVSDESSVAAALHFAHGSFGALDGLVNNAAIADPDNGPVEELSLETWNRRLSVNLGGYFLCAKHAVPMLRESRGAMVNIASTRALQSEPNTEAYAAAKGGIVALSHALAISLGPEVRVNCISPGWISTADWQKRARRSEPQLRPQDHRQHPVGRVGEPRDVAGLTAFLLSAQAGFITGQSFVLDGGMSRKMIYEE